MIPWRITALFNGTITPPLEGYRVARVTCRYAHVTCVPGTGPAALLVQNKLIFLLVPLHIYIPVAIGDQDHRER